MNGELRALVKESGLNNPEMAALRFRFCFACASRILHLLESDDAIAAYKAFESYLEGRLKADEFEAVQKTILEIANKHPGSKSIDGTKHSAVSATYALANAINGNAVAAAEYAAYSKTYGYGGYAVSDIESYQEEYSEQVKILKKILDEKNE